MAQHFRLHPLARNFSIATVFRMSDEEVKDFLCQLRWGSSTQQGCPHCGAFDSHYLRRRRRRRRYVRRPCSSPESPGNPVWQCKHCQSVFSVTTHTLFHATKLDLREILLIIVQALVSANGCSAIAMSHELDLSYKTAFLSLHRLREAMADDLPKGRFEGTVQMDGGYFCGKPRAPNRRSGRATKQQLARRHGKEPLPQELKPWEAMGMTKSNWEKAKNKRAIMVVVQSGGLGRGGIAVAVGVARHGETEYSAALMADQFVVPGSIVMTDEASAYNQLGTRFEHYTVSHSREYSTSEGVNDNHAEAFFSRLRRAEYGIYHGYRPVNLFFYACEAAWRHSYRHLPKSDLVTRLASACLRLPPSTRLRGYYEQNGRRPEVLIDSPG